MNDIEAARRDAWNSLEAIAVIAQQLQFRVVIMLASDTGHDATVGAVERAPDALKPTSISEDA